MKLDPIMEEIRRFRDEYAARFDYDVRAMLDDMRRRSAVWETVRTKTHKEATDVRPQSAETPPGDGRSEDAA